MADSPVAETVRLPPRWLMATRALVFTAGFIGSLLVYVFLAVPLVLPFRFDVRHRVLTSWANLSIWLLERTCNLKYRVEGGEDLPDETCVVMSNHQSTWETLVLKKFFPPMAWVVKRELLWLPVFGWGLAMVEPIALNRASGRKAVDQLVAKGRERMDAGRWVIVFPEGTRVAPGEHRRYKMGGAILASATGAPVIPVAHNAGYYWPRRRFIKYPGVIHVAIGPPIETRGKTPEQINREVSAWIETKKREIGAPRFV